MSDRKQKVLRRLRPAVQVDLPLPEPGGPVPDEVVDLAWWQRPVTVATLAALAALLAVLTVSSQLGARRDRRAATELESQVRTLTLRAPTRERALRVIPNPRSWSADPDARLRWPEPPEIVELYLPVGYARYSLFAINIDKADQGRMLLLQRLTPDSNRDLRISLNTSAFGPGEYRLKLQGYTWRGERVDVGWVRLVIS